MRVIGNLYWNQVNNLRLGGEQTEYVEIKPRVRQACILPYLIFNVYIVRVFHEALDGMDIGFLINGNWMNNISNAVDSIFFAALQASMTLKSKK